MNKISRFLYEDSVSYQSYLIIPFIAYRIDGKDIYSYALVAEQGYQNKLHLETNPATLYSSYLDHIINIAQEHLESLEELNNLHDSLYFYQRYVYNKNLIILHQQAGKCYYDHYPPDELRNIAAPKLFQSPFECLSWVKQGLDRSQVN